jgi:uncharacterized membrane protein YkoI
MATQLKLIRKELVMVRRMAVASWALAVVGAAVLVTSCSSASKSAKHDVAMPDAVAKTFKAAFPKAATTSVDAEKENGVMVYDIEFKDGTAEKETDITADGVMIEFTDVITAQEVPAAAMAAIRKAADGATIGRVERVTLSYETKDGKVVKLAQPATHYEVGLTKGSQRAEVVVNRDGTMVESPKWGEKGEKEEKD